MRPSALSYAFLLAFLCAAFLLQWMPGASRSFVTWTALMASLGLCVIVPVMFRKSQPRRTAAMVAMLAGTLGIMAACGAVARATLPPPLSHISFLTGTEGITLVGTVAAEPDRRPSMTQYTVKVERMQDADNAVRDVTGKILVRDSKGWPRYRYGDRLLVQGNLKEPWRIEDFDYGKYLELKGISAILTSATLELVETGKGSLFFRALFALKENFEMRIERLLPEPHASFCAGLLTGARRSIPKDVQESFTATGTNHILAISGYNITIILTLIGSMLFWLPFRARFLPSLAAVAAFTLFTGASASVARAAVMGSLGLLALQLGRKQETRLSILWTAFAMVLWKPQYLWQDASFQLSFLAVIGLSEASALIRPLTDRLPETLGIREASQATLSAQLMTLPWVLLLFGRLSLIAPVANLLIAPLIPLAMLAGFVSVSLSFLSLPLGQILAYVAWGILHLIMGITRTLASLPFASMDMRINVEMTVGLYALIGVLLWAMQRGSAGQKTRAD